MKGEKKTDEANVPQRVSEFPNLKVLYPTKPI